MSDVAPASAEFRGERLRVLIHDYGGYGFITQLGRELAARGHDVHLVHYAALVNGKGMLTRQPDDATTLSFAGIDLNADLDRYDVKDRLRLERMYAKRLVDTTLEWSPDVVVAANTPLLVLHWVRPHLDRAGIPLVNWLQDVHSVAIGMDLRRRHQVVGRAAMAALELLESRLLRSCSAVVPITEDFLPTLRQWGVPDDRITVVHNWAELVAVPARRNRFSSELALDDRTTLLYAGTLGLKHEPGQLVALAEAFRERDDVSVVVVSEGPGRDWLERERLARRLPNLVLADFQPPERVTEVVGAGDVLLSMIRPEAGAFSVPSKVLTYLAMGRAQLGALPAGNLAARLLAESGGGIVVSPDAPHEWTAQARRLVDDAELRHLLGRRGREFAEAHFRIEAVADTFEKLLLEACSRARPGFRRGGARGMGAGE